MIKKILSSLSIILVLGSEPISANSNIDIKALDFISHINFDNSLEWKHSLTLKKGASYEESKDPALRQGTENWEEPQGSFFAIPAAVLGVIVLVLFFTREK